MDLNFAADGDLRELSAEEAWETIKDFAQGKKECIAWDKIDNLSPQSTPQVLPSFEVYTPPMTYPKKVEETIGILMEVEPLDETKLEDLGLNTCNHDLFLSLREVPSLDEPKPQPQPQPLPNYSSLDVSLGDEKTEASEPSHSTISLDSFRMRVKEIRTNRAKKLLTSSQLAIVDPPGDITVPTTPPKRTVGENHASWSDKLDDALWAFRTAYKTPIGCTPYKLVYGKACHLPIELQHKAYWALKHAKFDLETAGDHQKVQLNELNELRDHAYEKSLIYKEKTKRIHDFKIKNRVFNAGVLLFNSRLKMFSGKLKSRWSEPFTIAHVFPYGTVELSQNSGPNIKVNGLSLIFEASRARGFVLRSQELQILNFIWEIQYPNLID
ncbi:reverse transcriptase domain-containing protein [Tanacetum coccineum]